VVYTYDAIAAARGITRAALGALGRANAARLFRWADNGADDGAGDGTEDAA